jgi:hypothetical protein
LWKQLVVTFPFLDRVAGGGGRDEQGKKSLECSREK